MDALLHFVQIVKQVYDPLSLCILSGTDKIKHSGGFTNDR